MSTRVKQTVGASAAGNESRRTGSKIERDPGAGNLQATTISFTASGTIADSGNGLGLYAVNDVVEVRGSAANSKLWTVATAGAGSITVTPAQITTESAGPTIILQKVF
ncbi:hypothetical protein UFOVP843_13 [uncultured Caudovirales phage]|uniref:Uncharacterized protein n=1 Tax=uncultured Caudovirales phage TaxID=2100421 RepID=A0A6J5PKP1_9CAUD|nr:hypothetical protein UFOVP843_13 [uncultured Caudovirales phage]CAB4172490.1 hypothetical protein UFOVP936_30 [uncultured Caudovirales phage]